MHKMTEDVKSLFKNIIKNELCQKPSLCKFALSLVDSVPGYFWYVPASLTGKFHPEHEHGDGGLARHSLMVYRWLKSILEDTTLDLSADIPHMVVAALFHDCCKCGIGTSTDLTMTAHEHPILGAKFVLDKAKEFSMNEKEFMDSVGEDEESFLNDVTIVVACIQTHMGKWNTSKKSTVVLPKPNSAIQYTVHLADYIASRKYTKFDEEFFKQFEG